MSLGGPFSAMHASAVYVYFAHMSSRILMPRNAMMLGEMAIVGPV